MNEHPNLAAALVAALSDLCVVKKGRTADMKTYKYDYAALEDCVEDTRPVLAEHGLVALTPLGSLNNGPAVSVVLIHVSGEKEEFGPFPFAPGRDAQATGSMVTYMRRYALLAALGMAAGDDDDDGATAVAKERVAAAQEKQAPPSEFLEVFNDLEPAVKNKVLGWLREQNLRPTTVPDDLMPSVFEFIASLEVKA